MADPLAPVCVPSVRGSFRSRMQRPGWILGLALILTLTIMPGAFAASPYASWTDPGVQTHNAGSVPNTPHGGYGLTTQKCAVCHAVHGAGFKIFDTSGQIIDSAWTGDTSASPVAAWSVPTSQLLLRGDVRHACEYCHIDTSIGGLAIYGGSPNIAFSSDPTVQAYGHILDAGTGNGGFVTCTDCHSVHGAMTMQGDVADKILKSGDPNVATDGLLYEPSFYLAGSNYRIDRLANDRNQQITAFCTKCHWNWATASDAVNGTINIPGYDWQGPLEGYPPNPSLEPWRKSRPLTFASGTATYCAPPPAGPNNPAFIQYQSHPMRVVSSGTAGIAYSSSTYCTDCHNAGQIYINGGGGSSVINGVGVLFSSFPHYTPSNASFLVAATNILSAQTGVAAGSDRTDGVCLRCHRANSITGVGLTY